jgi:hypothetical protein
MNMDLNIPHQTVEITVQGEYQGTPQPFEGVNVYVFTPTGSYLGLSIQTDENGKVVFDLPEKTYKVRADYLSEQYWSGDFQSVDTTITIDQGLAEVHVQRSGVDVEGARVYLFTESEFYLSWYADTDVLGEAEFLIPVGSYKLRVDEGGDQVWSSVVTITAGDVISVDMDIDSP